MPILAALVLLSAGCAIDGKELERWRSVARGPNLLAGYLADTERPFDLRIKAARLLFEQKQLAHLLGVVKETSPEDRKKLLGPLTDLVVKGTLGAKTSDEMKATGASLSFYLLEYVDELGEGADVALVEATVDWCLEWFAEAEAPSGDKKIRDILLGAAVARPQVAVPRMLAWMDHAKLQPLLKMNTLLASLKDGKTMQDLAGVLLERARALYPKLPEPLVHELIANRNETVLRFLLDAVRDTRVDPSIRDIGLDVARDLLRKKAVDGLLALLPRDDPGVENVPRYRALDILWDVAGVERLSQSLRSLPPQGSWPKDGESFRAEVDQFCDNRVARARAAAKPVLLQLIEDENWVARTYAMECVIRLYPQEAADLLLVLEKDDTELFGWSAEGPTTIGEVVTALQSG